MPSNPLSGGSALRLSRTTMLNLALTAAFGITAGLGLFTFLYAEGLSYFSDDPQSCINCHVMNEQYDAWNHSSHKAVAACNDCHAPPGTEVEKLIAKGINGWNHSLAFTTGNFPDPIRVTNFNARIAQRNCVDCHATAVNQMHYAGSLDFDAMSCVACHGNVGHGQAGTPLYGPIFPAPQSNRSSGSASDAITDADKFIDSTTEINVAEIIGKDAGSGINDAVHITTEMGN